MRKIALALSMSATASGAIAAPKAIQCDVAYEQEVTRSGEPKEIEKEQQTLTFVLDDAAKTLKRFNPKVRNYTEVCAAPDCKLIYGGARVSYFTMSDKPGGVDMEVFVLDREEGTYARRENLGGKLMSIKRKADGPCKPIPMPSLTSPKAKF